MRRAHGVVAACGLLLTAVLPACEKGGGGAGRTETAAVADSTDPICADSTVHQLCPVIPHEVVVQVPNGYTGLIPRVQARFDMFSWQTFVALNWPANADGTPMGSFDGNPGAPRVWETYLDAAEVYSAGREPALQRRPGEQVPGADGQERRRSGPRRRLSTRRWAARCSDVNMNYVLFEKKISPDEVTYLRTHRLNTVPGQMAADSADTALVFTRGRNDGPVGSIEVKAAWRVMMPGDDSTTYYLRHGVIYVPAANSATGRQMCLNATVGLVGLHIIHKTDQFKGDWIWTTFEHEANAPTCTDSAGAGACGASRPHWSFYNAACTGCVANDAMKHRPGDTTFLWQPNPPYAGLYPQGGGNFGVAGHAHPALHGRDGGGEHHLEGASAEHVWSHYHLIGSQWMSGELSDVGRARAAAQHGAGDAISPPTRLPRVPPVRPHDLQRAGRLGVRRLQLPAGDGAADPGRADAPAAHLAERGRAAGQRPVPPRDHRDPAQPAEAPRRAPSRRARHRPRGGACPRAAGLTARAPAAVTERHGTRTRPASSTGPASSFSVDGDQALRLAVDHAVLHHEHRPSPCTWMSCSGSPGTATTSANLPAASVPTRSSQPSSLRGAACRRRWTASASCPPHSTISVNSWPLAPCGAHAGIGAQRDRHARRARASLMRVAHRRAGGARLLARAGR